jgi:hypothetical protein
MDALWSGDYPPPTIGTVICPHLIQVEEFKHGTVEETEYFDSMGR